MPENYDGHIEVVGAYGRKYRTLASAKVDWMAELDFQLVTTSQYINMSGAIRYNLNVILRYGKNNEKVGTLR